MTAGTHRCPSVSYHLEGVTFVLNTTASSTFPVIVGTENMALLKDRLTSNPTASCSQLLLNIPDTWRAVRTAQIKALRGKYRHVLTPSDEFARQKQEDIARQRDGS
jgi:hypothetical protein